MTVGLVVLAFLAGAWVALVVRALFADAAQRRIQAAAETLDPEHLERLRGYIAEIDQRERERVGKSLQVVQDAATGEVGVVRESVLHDRFDAYTYDGSTWFAGKPGG